MSAIKNLTGHFAKNPKTLFLTDSLGAALTTFFLFGVLRSYSAYFGMPKHILMYLSLVAFIFCIYPFTCFLLLKGNWPHFIRAISMANVIYCGITIILVYIYFKELTKLGVTYFFIEIVIVITLVYIEFNVARVLKKLK
jgi:hypothetical protein